MDGCAGRQKKGDSAPELARTQSQRRAEDQQAVLGCGATRLEERLLAALGHLSQAPVQFERADDVPYGGVLMDFCGLGWETYWGIAKSMAPSLTPFRAVRFYHNCRCRISVDNA